MKDEQIIAEGVHTQYGAPHAEATAFSNADISDFSDCEVYVSLEPCDHFEGKQTPSCTDLLIQKKPKKIYIGSVDPHFNGKNIEKIKAAGIDIEVLDDGIHQKLNPFFAKHIQTTKPYIALKVAQSLDGRITNNEQRITNNSPLEYLTNKKSLQKVHLMRSQYTAILTTTKTILSDNPRMDVRLEGNHSDPKIIIIGKTHLPKTLNIFQQKNRKIFQFPDFQAFWESGLATKTDSIMTECGGTLNTYLLQNNFVDEIQLFIAPKIIGGNNTNSFVDEITLKDFTLRYTEILDSDVLMVFKK